MNGSAADWQPLAGPQRRYPARADDQATPRDERAICSRCLGGTCCTTEGPIALTAFDVLRLAAALDLSPADFLRLFTQDRFDGPDGPRYSAWLADPDNSVISFLRRRTLDAASPCIFLKYIAGPDGTPRRVCSVHPARPLACREYYHDTCKKRWTGEMAVLQAIGYEALRDGAIARDEIERRWLACGPATDDEPLSTSWQRAFWGEMRRAAQPDAANVEGAADARLAGLQDPIDAKIDRLLSTPNLRFEEKYGPLPIDEQLHRFDAGLTLATGGERERLLDIATRHGDAAQMFGSGELAHHFGLRGLVAATASPADELMQYSKQARRAPGLMELESPATLHVALFLALWRQPEAARPALRAAMAAHAANAIAWAAQTLASDADAGTDDDAHGQATAEAANVLALLAQAGYDEAAAVLGTGLVGAVGGHCRRWVRNVRRALALAPPSAAALRWLPLVAWCSGERASRRLLAALWSSPGLQQLAADDRLELADHSLRQPGFDLALLAPALPALTAWAESTPHSIWDARPSQLGECWHDAYVVRAIDRAGLRAAVRTVLDAHAIK